MRFPHGNPPKGRAGDRNGHRAGLRLTRPAHGSLALGAGRRTLSRRTFRMSWVGEIEPIVDFGPHLSQPIRDVLLPKTHKSRA